MATTKPKAKKRAAPKKRPVPPPQPEPRRALPKGTLPFEVDPKAVQASLATMGQELAKWARKGRFTKVRFKFRGKALLPDLPLGAVVAAEGLTFYWTGILRALVFNLAGRSVIDVELINDSEKKLAEGKEKLLSGDLDDALAAFRAAHQMDHDNPLVHLNLGIAFKLKGQLDDARAALGLAKSLAGEGTPVAQEAERLLAGLKAAIQPAP